MHYARREFAVSADDQAWLYAWSIAHSDLSEPNDDLTYSDNTLPYDMIQTAKTRDVIGKVINSMRGMLVEFYNEGPEVQPASAMICNWRLNDSIAERSNDIPWMKYYAVFHMNREYIGGVFRFAGHEEEEVHGVNLACNSIIMFPADATYSMDAIEGGEKWVMPVWFTDDPKYYMFNADGTDRSYEEIHGIPDHNQPATDHMKQLTG
jgi:hypothetical protein